MTTRLFYTLATACLLAACTTDIEELTLAPEANDSHSATLRLDGSIDRFDTTVHTRATTTEWDDRAVLYIQYHTASGLVNGTATYSESRDEWTVNYYGTITKGQTAKCEVYHFEDTGSSAITTVSLTPQNAVFADTQATYLYEDGTVTLKAHLKPLTGRIRFQGTAGSSVAITGLKWYSNYNISANTLAQKEGEIKLSVGNDGYTPYVYATFADAATRQISADSGNDFFIFRKTFESEQLTIGKSGYVSIPTRQSHNGWELLKTSLDFTVTGNGLTASFTMMRVKPGTFQMGSDDGYSDEQPVHSVTLTKAYYIGQTEVTQALWQAVMGYKPTNGGSQWSSTYGLGDDYPAYYVDYTDCQEFITKLNAMIGQKFRLPTEAEWEFAARGGTNGIKFRDYVYAGSNEIDDVAWYSSNSGGRAHVVGELCPNWLHIYDMSGNVRELCADWYGSYTSGAQTDPTGPTTGSYRVFRGGSWGSSAANCRSTTRNGYLSPGGRNHYLGLRLAL